MWFIFPQLAGLGTSKNSKFYGITCLAEAKRYLAHPMLGPRLVECSRAIAALQGRSIHAAMGDPDD